MTREELVEAVTRMVDRAHPLDGMSAETAEEIIALVGQACADACTCTAPNCFCAQDIMELTQHDPKLR